MKYVYKKSESPFVYYELGKLTQGDSVTAKISHCSNIRLMLENEFQNYLKNTRYEFFGGINSNTKISMAIPKNGYWYLVIDVKNINTNFDTIEISECNITRI